MRTETLWQGQRRAARLHWWRQVLDRPITANFNEDFDEIVSLRFTLSEPAEGSVVETRLAGRGW